MPNIDKINYYYSSTKFINSPKKENFFYKIDKLKINKIEKIIKLSSNRHVCLSINAQTKLIKNNIKIYINLL